MVRIIQENPFLFFQEWLAEAEASEPNDPTAMCLATADRLGRPSARMILLKEYDENGFVFFTNAESRKGDNLAANPYAALLFHWKSLRRQIRIEGGVEVVEPARSDAYFASRPRGSRIGAWASRQSRPMASYQTLKDATAREEKRFEGQEDIPRPPYWQGYLVRPERFEFWIDGEFRLHERYVYTPRPDGGWNREMLYP